MTPNNSTPLTRWGLPILVSLSVAACGNDTTSSSSSAAPEASSSSSSSSVAPISSSESSISSSSSSSSSSSTANTTTDLPLIIAINAGSTSKASYGGVEFQADKYSSGGTANDSDDSISGTGGEDALFQTERYGTYSYKIPVLSGTYTVDLHLAELYHEEAGLRTFNISVEDTMPVKDLDPYSEVGHDGAYSHTAKNISVTDGTLDITLDPSEDQGTLAGFAVYSADGGIDTSVPEPVASDCKGYVGITFDDGPSNTNAFVSALKKAELTPVTFFVNGSNIRNDADIKAMLTVGEVQSHGYTHDDLGGASAQQVKSSLQQNNDAIMAAGAPKPTIFRPPYGSNSNNIKSAAADLGMIVITWGPDSADWNGASSGSIANAVGNMSDGQVILMHENQGQTLAAIPSMAEKLKAKGLCPGKLDPNSAGQGRAVAP